MLLYGLPVLFALFVWWFSTGVIVYLDGLPRHTFRWSLGGATVVLLLALWGLWWSSQHTSVAAAYCAFTCSVLAWGWQEMGFLMGPLSGPRRTPCPEGARGLRRMGYAIQTILWHELAIIAGAVAVIAVTYGSPNQIGTWTFLLLWGMRLSAKLNLFLGVPNLSEEFLPAHLRYLQSYLRRRSMNLLFPVSVTLATWLLVVLVQMATADGVSPFDAAAFTFIATLLALAVLEHWFLVVPLPATALWGWSLRTHQDEREEGQSAADQVRLKVVGAASPSIPTLTTVPAP